MIDHIYSNIDHVQYIIDNYDEFNQRKDYLIHNNNEINQTKQVFNFNNCPLITTKIAVIIK